MPWDVSDCQDLTCQQGEAAVLCREHSLLLEQLEFLSYSVGFIF